MKKKNNFNIIKTIAISILAIVGIVVGFAINPTSIPINVLWGVFLGALFTTSIGIILVIEVVLR